MYIKEGTHNTEKDGQYLSLLYNNNNFISNSYKVSVYIKEGTHNTEKVVSI